jgi:hypothetical protein
MTPGTPHRPVVLMGPSPRRSRECLREERVSRTIVVGWDWDEGHHDVVVQDLSGHILWAGQVAHTRGAWDAWEGRLLARAQQQRSAVDGVMGTSHGLVVDWLSTRGIGVYPVNSKVSGARRQPSGAKTDR